MYHVISIHPSSYGEQTEFETDNIQDAAAMRDELAARENIEGAAIFAAQYTVVEVPVYHWTCDGCGAAGSTTEANWHQCAVCGALVNLI